MVKEFEKAGFPVVHMCNLIPVSTTVGANRIVPTISIPYPLGDPNSPREEQWKLRVAKINELPDSQTQYIRRNLYATTEQVTPDKQGRILISTTLRRHAGLTKDVTVIGVGTTAEIWDSERWEKQNEQLTAQSIATAMDELGF